MSNTKLVAAAAERNKQPILEIILKYISRDTKNETFLEIASGTGQHIAHFAPLYPKLTFQPSEFDTSSLSSIHAYADGCPTKNIKKPMFIDITTHWSSWNWHEKPNKNSIAYIYNANMFHISPYECTIKFFENVGELVKSGGLVITYGPYAKNGVLTPESNVRFDANLRQQDSEWGIRDIEDLKTLAFKSCLSLIATEDMPANNMLLVFEKNK